jgi:hypothetical protein
VRPRSANKLSTDCPKEAKLATNEHGTCRRRSISNQRINANDAAVCAKSVWKLRNAHMANSAVTCNLLQKSLYHAMLPVLVLRLSSNLPGIPETWCMANGNSIINILYEVCRALPPNVESREQRRMGRQPESQPHRSIRKLLLFCRPNETVSVSLPKASLSFES